MGIDSELANLIDHTNLKPDARMCDISQLCKEAVEFKFASVCVNPCYASFAAEQLKGSGVNVCCVVGFPLGAGISECKAYEARLAAEHGASEIDMVINLSFLKDGFYELVKDEISAVVSSVHNCAVKVIIETGLLDNDQIIKASLIVKDAGAHYVKTSTGFSTRGATVDDVLLIRKTIGDVIGVKASGGIIDYKSAIALVNAGANRLGTSKSVFICKTPNN